MRIQQSGLACLLAFVASSASAADWFDRISDRLDRVEQTSTGQIVLSTNNGGIAITVSGRSSTCAITSVLLMPPSGREKDWLAMVLSAIAAEHPISVYGNCNSATYQIEASRLIVDYKAS